MDKGQEEALSRVWPAWAEMRRNNLRDGVELSTHFPVAWKVRRGDLSRYSD